MSQATNAVVVGENPIAEAVAAVLKGRNIHTTVVSDLDAAMNCNASLLFPCWYPDPTVHTFADLLAYPQKLMECGLQFGQRLADPSASSAIINFAFLPAIYVGTALEDYVSTLRGGITASLERLPANLESRACVSPVFKPDWLRWLTLKSGRRSK